MVIVSIAMTLPRLLDPLAVFNRIYKVVDSALFESGYPFTGMDPLSTPAISEHRGFNVWLIKLADIVDEC